MIVAEFKEHYCAEGFRILNNLSKKYHPVRVKHGRWQLHKSGRPYRLKNRSEVEGEKLLLQGT